VYFEPLHNTDWGRVKTDIGIGRKIKPANVTMGHLLVSI